MNSFGRHFRITTWGESHGKGVGVVIDGCPSNLLISKNDIQIELNRRRPCQSSISTPRDEIDEVEIMSGIFEGKTTGTPISLIVKNNDADSSKYRKLINKPRPGHADYGWNKKFGHVDWRGGGRASARETIGRVAAASIAKKLLERLGIQTYAYTKQIGQIISKESIEEPMKGISELIESNTVRAYDVQKAKEMEDEVLAALSAKDSIGGVIEAVVFNVPAGIGNPIFGKLGAELSYALMSIPAAKGIEFGNGFLACNLRGSENNDEFEMIDGKIRTKSNNCGGILGGISTGMPIILRIAFKPTASIARKQNTVDLQSNEKTDINIKGRHDPCVIPRAVPIVESMINLVLVDQLKQNGMIPEKL